MNNFKIEAEKEAQIILNYFKTGDYISAEIKAKKLIAVVNAHKKSEGPTCLDASEMATALGVFSDSSR